jgi:hypothetical protein
MPSLQEISSEITKLSIKNKELYLNNELLLQLISNILQINKDPAVDKLIKEYLTANKCL